MSLHRSTSAACLMIVITILTFRTTASAGGQKDRLEPQTEPEHSDNVPVKEHDAQSNSLISDSVNVLDTNPDYFTHRLVEKYGSTASKRISVDDLNHLIYSLKYVRPESAVAGKEKRHIADEEETYGSDKSKTKRAVEDGQDEAADFSCGGDEWETDAACLEERCLSGNDLFKLYHLSADGDANVTSLRQMSPAILYEVQKDNCRNMTDDQPHKLKRKPRRAEVWGYGFLCVTIINLCAVCGLFFLPIMKKTFYKKLLMFMAALAVGTLSGSAVLVLIPECFGLTLDEEKFREVYLWKATTVVGGIYLFFVVERLLKNIMELRHEKKKEDTSHIPTLPISSVKTRAITRNDSMNMSFKTPSGVHVANSSAKLVGNMSVVSVGSSGGMEADVQNGLMGKDQVNTEDNGSLHGGIRSVAWMVIVGDGLHNFIDGLSIGAAFADSLLAGISVSVAVVCEELPHELGDFAILLNSGMNIKQAMAYNWLSACMAYLGLVVGVLVGELTEGSLWIFALAAGMFLYISLVDLLPEVNHAAEEEHKETGHTWPIFLIQNGGILFGYGIILLLAYFSGDIDFEVV